MHSRNSFTDAIILTTHIKGEQNRNVCILSPTDGIFYATLYGGAKSKLCSLVQPLNSGKIWIYKDTTRKLTKITDFDAKDCHLDIRQNLKKLYAAYFASEFVLKTKAAGDAKSAYVLLDAFLYGLNLITVEEVKSALIRFLWRYMQILGVQPQISGCQHCHSSFFTRKKNGDDIKYECQDVVYIPDQAGFFCTDCAKDTQRAFFLNKEAFTYIAAISASVSPKAVRALPLCEKSQDELRAFLFYLAEEVSGTSFKSLETCPGIL